MKKLLKIYLVFSLAALPAILCQGQQSQAERESRYYTISAVPIPDSIPLEVGGLAFNDKGQLAVATVMSATLAVDHRAVDGALGAELLAAFKRLVESPAAMLV